MVKRFVNELDGYIKRYFYNYSYCKLLYMGMDLY